jgi:cytoskeleton protein RodZ
MTDEKILDADTSTVTFAPLGEVLAEARAAKKLSQQDVSNHLRFSVKQVNALENNQFDALPDAMITRGFIRNYARYLDLDAEPLLESFKARRPSKTPGPVSVQSTSYRVMSGKDSQPWLKYILGSILILLFLLAWIFYIDYLPKANHTSIIKSPEIASPHTATEVPLPEIALPAAERQADTDAAAVTAPGEAVIGTEPPNATPDAVTPNAGPTALPSAIDTPAGTMANPAAVPMTPSTTNTVTSPPAPAASQNPIAPQPPNAAKPVSTNSTYSSAVTNLPVNTNATQTAAENSNPNAALSLSVTEKTWVNVKDKSGKVVFERILPAGGAETIQGEAPLNVIVGNAKATSLTYKGQVVNLASSATENNVARIKLE